MVKLDPTEVSTFMRYALCKNSILERGSLRKQLHNLDSEYRRLESDMRFDENRTMRGHHLAHARPGHVSSGSERCHGNGATTRDRETMERVQEYCNRILNGESDVTSTSKHPVISRKTTYPVVTSSQDRIEKQLKENPKLIFSRSHLADLLVKINDNNRSSQEETTTRAELYPMMRSKKQFRTSKQPELPPIETPTINTSHVSSMVDKYRKLTRGTSRRLSLPHLATPSGQTEQPKPNLTLKLVRTSSMRRRGGTKLGSPPSDGDAFYKRLAMRRMKSQILADSTEDLGSRGASEEPDLGGQQRKLSVRWGDDKVRLFLSNE